MSHHRQPTQPPQFYGEEYNWWQEMYGMQAGGYDMDTTGSAMRDDYRVYSYSQTIVQVRRAVT